MLSSLSRVLGAAQRGGYAVGSFNTNNLELSQAIIAAAEKSRSPVIISLSESALSYGGAGLIALTQTLARAARVPVVLHLDHGRSLAVVRQALEAGFTSVMFDGSALPFDRNVALTRTTVRLAGRRADVEGEIGTIGGQEDKVKGSALIYPSGETVERFVRLTGIRAVAVGLGTSHGLPVPHEHLELELLAEIASRVRRPIVLHGASNLPATTIRAGIRRGIAKINIDTELRQAFTGAVREELSDQSLFDPRAYLGAARAAVEHTVTAKLRLFGSVNQAR